MQKMTIEELRDRAYKIPESLTFKAGNPKLDKNKKLEKFKKYWVQHLNLIPSNISGYETCASKSKGCAIACLHTAGNSVFMPQKTLGRTNRTLMYFKERAGFLAKLCREIRNHEINCKKKGLIPVVRLNTTSDIMWEAHKVFQAFPKVQFYDYTKHFKRMLKFLKGELPKNYHLTFSLNEANHSQGDQILKKGGNVAIVFRKELPKKYKGFKVVNGDIHDLRFLEKNKNVVVGLYAKGLAKKDASGFVVDPVTIN